MKTKRLRLQEHGTQIEKLKFPDRQLEKVKLEESQVVRVLVRCTRARGGVLLGARRSLRVQRQRQKFGRRRRWFHCGRRRRGHGGVDSGGQWLALCETKRGQ